MDRDADAETFERRVLEGSTIQYPGGDQSREELVQKNITRLRNQAGWSQSELARRMIEQGFSNYNQMMVSRTEKGERPLRLDEVFAYSRVFGVYLYDLWLPEREAKIKTDIDEANRCRDHIKRLTQYLMHIQQMLIGKGEWLIKQDGVNDYPALWKDLVAQVATPVRDDVEVAIEQFQDQRSESSDRQREERDAVDSVAASLSESGFWEESLSNGVLEKLWTSAYRFGEGEGQG